ncbi:MAG TPA: hypothetical protein PLK51_07200 [Bacteroidales bacterium]|nr:hypothetical protein [Bacteroidales bacterium]
MIRSRIKAFRLWLISQDKPAKSTEKFKESSLKELVLKAKMERLQAYYTYGPVSFLYRDVDYFIKRLKTSIDSYSKHRKEADLVDIINWVNYLRLIDDNLDQDSISDGSSYREIDKSLPPCSNKE